jgi:hypothetical protein
MTVLYISFYLIKRGLILLTPLIQSSGLQMVFLMLGIKFGVIAYGWMRPHVMRWRRNMEFFNESLVMLVSYSCLSMTEFNESVISVFNNGYHFLSYVAFLVVVNFIVQGLNIKTYRLVKKAAEFKKKKWDVY